MSLKKLTPLTLAAAFAALCLPAHAETATASAAPAVQSSTSGFDLSKIRQNMRASYQMWLYGMNTRAMSGNLDGSGTNLNITHYATLGYKVSRKWSVSVTQPFNQTIDEKPASEVDPVVSLDPYITFSNASITKSDRYGTNLSGYIRYYAPLSRSTNRAANAGARSDAGNGALRLLVTPSKTFMDGALTVSGTTLLQYRFPGNSSAERAARGGSAIREDYYILFNPSVAYAISSKVEAYVEYASGYLRHSTDGKFSKFNDPVYGQYISPGINWQASKRLALNPYLSVGPVFRGVKNTDIGVIGTYSFL